MQPGQRRAIQTSPISNLAKMSHEEWVHESDARLRGKMAGDLCLVFLASYSLASLFSLVIFFAILFFYCFYCSGSIVPGGLLLFGFL
ncbi:hypothetical protein B0T21DRAFT_211258 [Apiosordaria backusii]|uniref:Uncharacterized protein n=1 Tax=Apiosordaria backusii TaxID=314023 RepID=A0AA40E722_9PEZI|nr:hypothetical protein B0T21DRAFT_211258 [Apiosordaria backusii]